MRVGSGVYNVTIFFNKKKQKREPMLGNIVNQTRGCFQTNFSIFFLFIGLEDFRSIGFYLLR